MKPDAILNELLYNNLCISFKKFLINKECQKKKIEQLFNKRIVISKINKK